MFALVAAGRLPLTSPQQVDATHLVFSLEDANTINHVTVFMDGSQAFPPGYSATVHFLWPGEGKQWMLLGCLRNTKPSAIFKLRGTAIPSTSSGTGNAFTVGSAPTSSVTASLGISIETDAVVDAQMAALTSACTGQQQAGVGDSSFDAANAGALVKVGSSAQDPSQILQTALVLAPRIAKNAFAFLSSFAPDSAPQTAPLLQKWLEQFERKLKMQGASFLEKDE